MTFSGSGLHDLQRIIEVFPRDFKWPMSRARQAIIAGQQTDLLRVVEETRTPTGGSGYAVYENIKWRKEWITRAWGNREPNVESTRQEHS